MKVHQEIDKFTSGFVRKRARSLAGKHGFPQQDRDDIEQDLYLKLAKHLDRANPQDPTWKAFVSKTVSRYVSNRIRDSRAKKRRCRCEVSIHTVVGTDAEGPVELASTVGENETPAKRGRSTRSDRELVEMTIDVAVCIDRLDDSRERELCHRLKQDSIAQVARDMEVPRTTLNSWLRKIRERFEDHEIQKYLHRNSSGR